MSFSGEIIIPYALSFIDAGWMFERHRCQAMPAKVSAAITGTSMNILSVISSLMGQYESGAISKGGTHLLVSPTKKKLSVPDLENRK
ncbi:MAG: hypothetical protein BWY84_00691 [Candidatus Aerophobetes bacterium ADurb.Bin490]|nr:MAG: hypothetical protein BWY84_00691 [Candidatus Aerophobetes bacterium ADurb.Bin490]HRQ44749.1 hypothetical protein [Candidatus Goldiibacteriota bacterium]